MSTQEAEILRKLFSFAEYMMPLPATSPWIGEVADETVSLDVLLRIGRPGKTSPTLS